MHRHKRYRMPLETSPWHEGDRAGRVEAGGGEGLGAEVHRRDIVPPAPARCRLNAQVALDWL